MAFQVIEYMDENPEASFKDVIVHFGKELEVDQQLSYILNEVEDVLYCREKLRPLYAKKMKLDTELTLLDSVFDMEVMVAYPPRQGSDKDRKAYKLKLQQEHEEYPSKSAEVETLKEEILVIETEMANKQQQAKNARRIIETYNQHVQFVLEMNRTSEPNKKDHDNSQMF